jgi:tRNA/tmRNA/rRNA uracil-C5-methylase (TrmA/RlmC/RlmD family)
MSEGTGNLVELEIGPVAHGGHCVARHEGRVVFVRHALPGERVRARLTESGGGKRFWRADAVEVLTAAPDRVTPPCPLAGPGRCGGCDWQHATPAAQRRLKADVVREQLTRLAGLDRDVVVEALPVDGRPDDGLGWRTRMRFAVDAQGRTGLRRHRSHDVIPVPACPISHPAVQAAGVGAAIWRQVEAVEVVTAGPTDDGSTAGGTLVVVEPAADAPGMVRLPDLTDGVSVAVRGESGLDRVRGRTWVREEVDVAGSARAFRVTGAGFWQVHPAAAQTLLDAVLAGAQARPGDRVADLYAGVGLFAAGLAAAVGPDGLVVAVESEGRAVSDGRRSLHDLPNVRFEPGAVERVLADPEGPLAGGADVVVLDPPRVGAGAEVMRALAALGPRRIVYVACDPAALARDLATATGLGYHLGDLRAWDLFPMTHHVECVAVLERDTVTDGNLS